MRTIRTGKTNLIMQRFLRIGLVLVLTMAVSALMPHGWYGPQTADATVGVTNDWVNIYTNAPNLATETNVNVGTPAISAGTDRLFMAAACFAYGAAPTSVSVSMSLGGTALTMIPNPPTLQRAMCFMGYLKETLPSGNLTLTYNIGGTTTSSVHVKWAVYNGVDQTTPVNSSYNNAAAAASVTFGSTINYLTGGKTVYVANNGGTGSTEACSDASFSVVGTVTSTGHQSGVEATGNHAANGSYAASITSTWSGGTTRTRSGIAILAVNQVQCTDPDPATLTITTPTSGSTVNGIYTVRVQVGTEPTPSGMTNMVVNIANAGACNVTNGVMTWNAGTSRWEYNWNTVACGDPTPVTGVTIDVSGTDPTPCNNAVNAPQVNNITINNYNPAINKWCGDCHAYPPGDGTRSGATGSFVGDHQVHAYVCSTCHVTPATETSVDFAHRNGQINMKVGSTAIDGGYYDKDNSGTYAATDATFNQTNAPVTQSCRAVGCHGGSTTPQWGVGTTVCSDCHGGVVKSVRRTITGASGDFAKLSRHVSGTTSNTPVKATCQSCHGPHLDLGLDPDASLLNADTGSAVTFDGTAASATAFCQSCHDANGASRLGANANKPFTDSADNTAPPNIYSSGWGTGTTTKATTTGFQSHRANAECLDCHGNSANTGTTTNPRMNSHASATANLLSAAAQYSVCFGTSAAGVNGCHGSTSTISNASAKIQSASTATGGIHPIFGSAVPLANIKSAIMRTRTTLNTTTATDGHDDLFVRGWKATSTMVCSDCHSQNGATGVSGPHGSAYGYILKGLDQTPITKATSTRTLGGPYPLTFSTSNQENICLNCHAADIYGDGKGGVAANDTIDTAGHTISWTNSGTSNCGGSDYAGTTSARINCLNCHAGSNPAGGYGAHGSTRAVSTPGQTFSTGYTTQSTGFINGDSWTQAPNTSGCYNTGAATTWSNCSHSSPHN